MECRQCNLECPKVVINGNQYYVCDTRLCKFYGLLKIDFGGKKWKQTKK